MVNEKKSFMLEQILSESIWQYYNLIKKYFKINENYVDIVFYSINQSTTETNYTKFLSNVEFKLNEMLLQSVEIHKNKISNIIIGQKNDVKGFIHSKDFKNDDFLIDFSKLLYLIIKRIEMNETLAKEVVFKQFIIDKNDSIILILSKDNIIENYNLKALSFFKYDIKGKHINLFLKNQKLRIPEDSYDSFYMDLIIKRTDFKAKISSYKDEKILLELLSK